MEPVITQITSGNLAPSYEYTLERNGTEISLTTVDSVQINIVEAKSDEPTATAYGLSIIDASNGEVRYTPQAAHFPTEGRYKAEVILNHATGLTEVLTNYINFVVRGRFV